MDTFLEDWLDKLLLSNEDISSQHSKVNTLFVWT
jgi:hypothetical protein